MKLPSWLHSSWSRGGVGIIVVAVVFIVGGLSWLSWCYWWDCSCREWLVTGSDCRESGSTTLRNLVFVVGGLVAIGFGIWRGVVADRQAKASQLQVAVSQRSLLNEQYQKGAEMLGSNALFIRLGGIYALQGLAEQEPELYHVPIVRMFCAFMRNLPDYTDKTTTSSSLLEIYEEKFRSDVIGIMRAIGNRSDTDVELEKKSELSHSTTRCGPVLVCLWSKQT